MQRKDQYDSSQRIHAELRRYNGDLKSSPCYPALLANNLLYESIVQKRILLAYILRECTYFSALRCRNIPCSTNLLGYGGICRLIF